MNLSRTLSDGVQVQPPIRALQRCLPIQACILFVQALCRQRIRTPAFGASKEKALAREIVWGHLEEAVYKRICAMTGLGEV